MMDALQAPSIFAGIKYPNKMNYEKNVNRLLNWLSEQSQIPKENLHLINITPELLDKALTAYTDKKISLHKAEEYIKKQWAAAAPSKDRSTVTAKEMEMMGFVRVDNAWKHKITDTIYTDDQIKALSFKEIEDSIINNPLYDIYQMYKKKFDQDDTKQP